MNLFNLLFVSIYFDAPEPWQIGFQDAASSLGEEISWFHDKLLFYFVLISIVVLWMITQIVLSFRLKKRAITHKYLSHGTVLEIIWTLTPAFILVTIAFPSFKLLYLMDEIIDPSITIKAIGFCNDGLKYICPVQDIFNIDNSMTYFFIPNIRAKNRIGPHNQDVISVIFGGLLANAYANKRPIDGVRICYRQNVIHLQYLLWLYNFFYERGYVSNLTPRLYTRIVNKNVYEGKEFNTFTFRSFFWIHKLFYSSGKKKLPSYESLYTYLTPLALAIWIMDDGGFVISGVRIATYNFSYNEHLIIVKVLKDKYDLDCTIQTIDKKYCIYIKSKSLEKLRKIVDAYIISSMKYKLGQDIKNKSNI